MQMFHHRKSAAAELSDSETLLPPSLSPSLPPKFLTVKVMFLFQHLKSVLF